MLSSTLRLRTSLHLPHPPTSTSPSTSSSTTHVRLQQSVRYAHASTHRPSSSRSPPPSYKRTKQSASSFPPRPRSGGTSKFASKPAKSKLLSQGTIRSEFVRSDSESGGQGREGRDRRDRTGGVRRGGEDRERRSPGGERLAARTNEGVSEEGSRDRDRQRTRRAKPSKYQKEAEGSGLWSYTKDKHTRRNHDGDGPSAEVSGSGAGSGSKGLTPLTTSSTVTFASSSASVPYNEEHVRLYPESRSIQDEFDFSTPSTSSTQTSNTTPAKETDLPTSFASPPLMPGLVDSLKDVLGARAKPTAIQALAMRWLLKPFSESDSTTHPTTTNLDAESTSEVNGEVEAEPGNEAEATENKQEYRQFLLASETGSGKSIAYFLPLLQSLKQSELSSSPSSPTLHNSPDSHATRRPPAPLNPRALVLAPTHELSRQLATFGKGLIHNIKLRVMSASRANVPNDGRSSSSSSSSSSHSSELTMRAGGRNMSASRMAKAWEGNEEGEQGEFEVNGSSVRGKGRDVDVLVGTPKRLLEMAMGHGWDREARRNAEVERGGNGRKWVVGPREVGLEGVEWVVVDEADTLLDSDFKEETTRLLSEIAAARGYTVPPSLPSPSPPSSPSTTTTTTTPSTPSPSSPLPHAYPFNFILTSATIPTSLSTYLSTHHPTLTRLASPRLHRFPTNLRIEHHPYTTGNPYADIERKIKFIWAQQALEGSASSVNGGTKGKRTKMVIFRQKKTQAVELGKFLRERGFKVVVVTGGGGNVSVEDAGRTYGSNRHIQPFLNPARSSSSSSSSRAPEPARKEKEEKEDEPRILISTSLLARGLDFAPEVTHVLMVDPTRNTADFLHRAGRTARAGREGTVVLFTKEGRGSERGRELRKRVEELRRRK